MEKYLNCNRVKFDSHNVSIDGKKYGVLELTLKRLDFDGAYCSMFELVEVTAKIAVRYIYNSNSVPEKVVERATITRVCTDATDGSHVWVLEGSDEFMKEIKGDSAPWED